MKDKRWWIKEFRIKNEGWWIKDKKIKGMKDKGLRKMDKIWSIVDKE